MKNIEAIVEDCTCHLRGDPELQKDVARELRSHLEEKIEELHTAGLSDEASREAAIREFGDPAEIADELLGANLARLKWRGKLRLAAKIAVIPLLLLAVVLAVDFRNIDSIRLFRSLDDATPDRDLPLPKLPPDRELIVYGDRSRTATGRDQVDQIAAQRAIWEKHPDNKMYLANYITARMAHRIPGTTDEKLFEELAMAKKVDPVNAFYDYCTAAVLLEQGIRVETPAGKTKHPIRFTILDRAKLDRAMAEVKTGLAKPEYQTYAAEMLEHRLRQIDFKPDLLGGLQRVWFSSMVLLPHCGQMRRLARTMPFYGRLLIAEGKPAEGEFFLNAWKPFALQFNGDAFTFIEQLVLSGMLTPFIQDAEAHGDAATVAELTPVQSVVGNWRALPSDLFEKKMRRHAGMMASILLPALHPQLDNALLAPERGVNYTLFDSMLLAAQGALIVGTLTIVAILLAILYCCRRRGFLIVPPGKSWRKVFGCGLLLPLALWLLFTHLDALSGRDYALSYNMARNAFAIFYFLLAMPVFFLFIFRRELRRRFLTVGGNPREWTPTLLLNGFFALTAALLITAAILRPLQSLEQRYYIKQDRLIFNVKTFSFTEDRLSADFRQQHREALLKAKNEIRLPDGDRRGKPGGE
jgi:hypothetical protein